eukprot:Pgem_evm1s19643
MTKTFDDIDNKNMDVNTNDKLQLQSNVLFGITNEDIENADISSYENHNIIINNNIDNNNLNNINSNNDINNNNDNTNNTNNDNNPTTSKSSSNNNSIFSRSCSKFINFFRPVVLHKEGYKKGGLFNKQAVYLTKKFTNRFIVKSKSHGIIALTLYLLLISFLMGLFFWLNGFAATGSVSAENNILQTPMAVDCRVSFANFDNISADPIVIRCSPVCQFFSNSSRPAYINQTISTGGQSKALFNGDSNWCAAAIHEDVVSYWTTVAVIQPVCNSTGGDCKRFTVSKPYESRADITIGYFFCLIIIVFLFGMNMLMVSVNFPSKHKITHLIWFFTLIVFSYFYVVFFEYSVPFWVANNTMQARLQTLLPFLAISYLMYQLSVRYTFFPMSSETLLVNISSSTKLQSSDVISDATSTNISNNGNLTSSFNFDNLEKQQHQVQQEQKQEQEKLQHNYLFDFTIFYVVPTLLFIHLNVTEFFDNIPQISFSNQDNNNLNSAPGIILLLVVMLAIILCAGFAFYQAYRCGRLLVYIVSYVCASSVFVIFTICMAQEPFDLSFHVHHYFLAILLWPLTLFKNRFSSFCQGALLGLFINGTARWQIASLWVR